MNTKNLFISYLLSVLLTILSIIFARLRIVGSDPDLIYFGFPIKYLLINVATGEQVISVVNFLINSLLFLPLAFYLINLNYKKNLKLILNKPIKISTIFLLKWLITLNLVQIVSNTLIPPIIINEMVYSKPTYPTGTGDIFTTIVFLMISILVLILINGVYFIINFKKHK